MKKTHIVVITAIFLVILFVLASFLVTGKKQESAKALARKNAEALIRDHSPVYGDPAAKVVITKFMDPACETCGAFHPYLKQMIASAPGRIKMVIRYAPLHAGADIACAALEAAGRQGKYWETLQFMYETQPQWTEHHAVRPDMLWKLLPRIGLNVERLKKDMNDPTIVRIIQQDMADARTLQVTKTPGFFVNGKPLVVFGYDQLRAMVEAELRTSY